MSYFAFQNGALAGLLLFGSQFLAHAQTASNNLTGSAVTTGIVGLTSTQTARLNALNLQPVIPGVAAVFCPATLQFYDDTGALLKQLVVTNISSATSASFVIKPPLPSTAVNARAQIRAVVFVSLAAVVSPGPEPPSPSILPVGMGCNIMPSLEIIDDSTGDTRTLTTDFRAMSAFRFLPPQAAAIGR